MGSRLAVTSEILKHAVVGEKEGKTLFEKWTEKKPERADSDFPLNMRILSRVSLDNTKFYLAEDQLQMPEPTSKGTMVQIGTITHKDGMIDYLARISPDDAIEGSGMTLLLVETQGGKVLSTKLFTQGGEEWLNTPDQCTIWLDPEEGLLGGEILTNPKGIEYVRLWGNGARVEPMHAREEVLADRFGRNIINNDLIQMMFGREVFDNAGKKLTDEFALVSIVNEERVEILYGVPVNITADSIIGA